MAWVNPLKPNLIDFFTFAYLNGTPTSSLPLPSVTITSGGSGYTTPPSVTFSSPGIGITMAGTAIVSDGVVTGVNITNPGTNYSSAPTVTFGEPPAGGTQATGTVTLGSPWPATVLNMSMDRTIRDHGNGARIYGELSSYVMACYNLAFHLLLEFTPDPANSTFFTNARKQFALTQFRPGIVMASGDQATSQTLIVPAFFQNITLEALEATKTPWGRQWVEYEQMYGQTIWDYS